VKLTREAAPSCRVSSETTVKSHVTHVFSKLRLRDRAQAVVVAYESGLVEPGEAADH
jgi:ATP/maltotriose-dependent transcriptional regulator MalT